MKLPVIEGIIERRMLINFAVDKDVLANYLPSPFRPKLIQGRGIAGICLIRLRQIRPKGFPAQMGIGSENAAHRIAVEWTENGKIKEGVYIPRRDTDSHINHWAGGRVFPGVHHLAEFDVSENEESYKLDMRSDDGTGISLLARQTKLFYPDSVFQDLESASAFFRKGSIGFSPNQKGYDGLELQTMNWHVDPLAVEEVKSSFFGNKTNFPEGSVTFDNALLMKEISHTWHTYQNGFCP